LAHSFLGISKSERGSQKHRHRRREF
jgi:hypothetical protein